MIMNIYTQSSLRVSNGIQLLTLVEWSRKYGVSNPYDKSEYDYITAYRRNISPDSNGKWPRLEKDDR